MDEVEPTLSFDTSLAAYGTLRAGEEGHHLVRNIPGVWVDGVVRGFVYEVTWGEAEGFPGITLSNDGNLVPVSVLCSDELHKHLGEIDRYEGPGYERRAVTVFESDGETEIGQASIYEALTTNDD